MTNNTYNGWANRETWLVNLYFGDSFSEYIEEKKAEGEELDQAEVASIYEDYFQISMEEEIKGLSGFLSDFIDLGLIDWNELAEHVLD